MKKGLKLRKYQEVGIKKALQVLKTKKGFLIADETGVGKTPQALFIAKAITKPKENVLVLCPAFLKLNWIDEINKWSNKRNYNLLLYTYTEIINLPVHRALKKHKYRLLILDEMHYLKDFESLRTQAVYGTIPDHTQGLYHKAYRILGLSATPIPNRVGEIWPWLYRTKATTKSYEKFVITWAKTYRETNWGLSHKGVKNADELFKKMQSIMIRRKKHDVLKELPPGIRQQRFLPCSEKLYKQEKKLLAEALAAAKYSENQIDLFLKHPELLAATIGTMPSFDELTIFKKIQGLFKAKGIIKILKEDVIPVKKKFIIFCYHREVAQFYFDNLPKKLNKILITGDIDKDERHYIVKDAAEQKESILIATMHSVKEGLNTMIGFDRAYFAELDWAPYILTQCEGRLLRMGQKNAVLWFYFIFDRGIEKYIYDMLNEKNEAINKILDGPKKKK